MDSKKIRIVFMGTPEFAVETLKAMVESGYNVVGVVTVPDKPAGRGQKMSASAVKTYALEHNLPVLQPVKMKDPEFLSELEKLQPELQIVVAFRMLPKEVWQFPPLGTINLHGSLLPQYRGAAPINWAVINGEKHTGITTFFINETIDTGNILLQKSVEITPLDTAGSVHDKLMVEGAGLILKTIDGVASSSIKAKKQTELFASENDLKPAPKIFKNDCRIHWSHSAEDIYNKIRGLSPYPAAWTYISKGDDLTVLKLYEVDIVKGKPDAPGVIYTDGKSFLHVSTKDAWIKIISLQMAGKKRMDIEDFLRGRQLDGQLL